MTKTEFITKIRQLVMTLSLAPLLFPLGINNAFAVGYDLPGVNASGFGFKNPLTVSWRKKGSNYEQQGIARRATGTLNLVPVGGILHTVDKMTFKLKASHNANVDLGLGFNGGTLSIKGGISTLGIANNTLLFTADLTSFNFIDGVDSLFGYSTTITYCDAAFAMFCTNNESVYMQIMDGSIFDSTLFATYSGTGKALTTIPVPAAVWLFGSGLLGLIGVAKQCKKVAV